jgi:hypothetical protein
MKRTFTTILLCIATMLVSGSAHAAVTVTARVQPEVVPVGSEATLVITVNGKFRRTGEPQLPKLDDFQLYQAGTSQSFSIVNGQRSVSLVFTYVLVPKKEGQYKIAPIRFETDGKVYTANPLSVEVVKSVQQLPAPTPAPGGGPTSDEAPIFIRGGVDRDTVYVNQQVTWKLGFYTDGRIDLLRSPEYSPPNSEGFWVEDLPPQKNYYTSINGKKYLVNEILRGFFPTAPGEYTIGSAKVEIVIDDFTGRPGLDDFFGRGRGRLGFGKPRTLTTEPVTVTVLRLPSRGRPGEFSGLVGRGLEMSLKVDKNEVRAGEPVNVTLEVTGEGNFKTMAAPKIPEIEGFKMYESGSTSELFKSNYIVSGRKITNFVLIPRDEGEVVIPPVKLSYFDPYARHYRTIQSSPLRLDVRPGAQGEGGTQVVFTGSGEDIEVLGRDIHHIHPATGTLSSSSAPFYASKAYAALHALPLLAVMLALVFERRRRRWLNDSELVRARRAARQADKRIAAARGLLKANQAESVFSAVSAAVRGYVADKMNTSPMGLIADDIDGFLSGQNIDEEVRKRTLSLLATCDGAQYSAAAATAEVAGKTVADASALIAALEKGLS